MKSLLLPLKYIIYHPLTKDRPIKGILRFLQWQIISRLNAGSHIHSWFSGLKLSVKRGMHGATGCIYVGLPEFEDMSFLLHFLREDDLFIDIGANVGSYTILASGNNKCKSISVEPVPSTFKFLERNVEINNLINIVSLNNIGVGSEEGNLHFTNGFDTTNHVVKEASHDSIRVPINTLDNLALNLKVEKDILVKLDVEGFEYNVLVGGERTLRSNAVKAIIVELNGCGNRYGFKDSSVDEKLRSFGFSTYSYNPFSRALEGIPTFNSQENTLYIKKEFIEDVKKKITYSKSFKVFNKRI